jgi:ElaB/YqjD/DUF883 family membrane-anchored ribosome-binding protein
MRHNGGRKPDEILAEIDRTRGEMDRTLNAIEHRLTPGQLMDQSIDYLRNSGANEFVQNLGGAAKHNPLPVALVGIGLTWLMALGRQPAQHQGLGSSVSKSQVGDTVGSMRDRAGQVTDTAREQWQRARGGIDHLVNEQPLALGAIGLAIGAVLAAAAPRTSKEEELMGTASRNLADKAKETAKEAAERAAQTRKEPQSSGHTPAPPATPSGAKPPRQGA